MGIKFFKRAVFNKDYKFGLHSSFLMTNLASDDKSLIFKWNERAHVTQNMARFSHFMNN